jgi:signal peptidase
MPPAGEDGGSDDPEERGGDSRLDDEAVDNDDPGPEDGVVDTDDPEPGDDAVAGSENDVVDTDGESGGDGRIEGDLEGSGASVESGEPFVMGEPGAEESEGRGTGETGGTAREDPGGTTREDPLDVSAEIDPSGRGPGGSTGRERSGPIGWLLRGEDASATFLREFLGSVLVVVVVGMLLFAISGVWPPMVAVKSGSMEPQMERGDLIFVMEEHRFPPAASVQGTGIATYDSGSETGYRRFDEYGDVIIYRKDGDRGATPIIHRARFWVNGGENWYDRANESFVDGEDCEAIRNCPAPHAGFITKGDNNDRYDQVSGISDPVRPGWVKGTAELRIPWLGHVRLELSELTVASASSDEASLRVGG